MIDVVTHGWDLAQATGQDYAMDEDIAEMLYQGSRAGVRPEFRKPPISAFGPEVPVSDEAPASHRLLALLGRSPA